MGENHRKHQTIYVKLRIHSNRSEIYARLRYGGQSFPSDIMTICDPQFFELRAVFRDLLEGSVADIAICEGTQGNVFELATREDECFYCCGR